MRFARYDRPGAAADVLSIADGPAPIAGAGEVVVRVLTSGVNPSDVKTRTWARAPDAPPFTVPHNDGAGIITAVGAGVDAARIGERVWLWNAQQGRQWGTAAEFIALPSGQAVRLPDHVSFEEGATLGVPWLTAWRAVHIDDVDPAGMTVLVQGGAGAVGSYAIQLAKRAGYRVITTISSPEKARLVRELGADVVIDYKREDLTAAIAEATDRVGVDRIIEVDLAANASTYTSILQRDGLVVVYGSRDWAGDSLPLLDWLFHGIRIAIFIVYNLADDVRAAAIEDSFVALSEPGFKATIAARFPLARIAEAHELVESGTAIGNVIVLPGE